MTTDTATFVMPFGKHKSKPLAEIPKPYLRWVVDNVETLYPETREAINAHLAAPGSAAERQGTSSPRKPRATRKAKDAPSAACAHCGLAGSAGRPLVHADCASDNVPF